MKARHWKSIAAVAVVTAAAGAAVTGRNGLDDREVGLQAEVRRARNIIFFIGDGMGVSTVTAGRIFSVGVDGQLVIDQFPHTALSRTYSADSITADSAPTMTAMMTGVNTNQSVIGYDEKTEANDFNSDGNGEAPWTLLELAKRRGMRVGAVSTAQITHATPAATYAHVNQRNNESDIALQALPGDSTFNRRLGKGLDVLMGGGRRFFVSNTLTDEEGVRGARADGRDLRSEFQTAGYNYVWNKAGLDAANKLPLLGLFESSHMEYEYDRPTDLGGEPSLTEMTVKAIRLLQSATRRADDGYFLHVEAGRIDHGHHAGNAYRALTDMQELDAAIGAAVQMVSLRDTLIIVSADHSHVFNIAGYPLRPLNEMPYPVKSYDPGYEQTAANGHGLFDLVYDIDQTTGHVSATGDRNGVPYTVLGYHNGPGYRGVSRVDPRADVFKGLNGVSPDGPAHPAYFQEAAVPMGSETHAGEDVTIYAIGPGSELVRGTVKNTHIFNVMRKALGPR